MDKKLIFRCFDCKKNYRKEINKRINSKACKYL